MTIDLTLAAVVSKLHNLSLYEPTDPVVLNKLLQSTLLKETFNNRKVGEIYKNEEQQLTEYKKLVKVTKKLATVAYARVKYSRPKGMKFGRCNPERGLGLYNIRREIRHTLALPFLEDIDIKNCHPVILHQVLKSNHLESIAGKLKAYIDDRDTYLNEVSTHYNVPKDAAKKLFIKLLYGGGIASWRVDNSVDGNIVDMPFLDDFKTEFAHIASIITNHNPILKKEVIKRKAEQEKTNYNLNGCVISYFLQEYECRILEQCYLYCVDNGYIVNNITVLAADGFMIPKDKYTPSLLCELEHHIMEKTGFELTFVNKAMDMGFLDILDSHLIVTDDFKVKTDEKEGGIDGVTDDDDATNKLFELYPHWVNCKEELFVFDTESGMWDNNKTAYFKIMNKYSSKLHTLRTNKDGDLVKNATSYGNTVTLMEKIPPLMKMKCRNDNWLTQKQDSSLGYLLFNNGYLDCKKMVFYAKEEYGFNPDIVFFGKIHHDFEAFNDEDRDYMDDIEKRLFHDVLGKEVGDYFMLNLGRGLAGDCMKRMLFGLGDTNTGKTVLTTALRLSCGDYFGAFNAGNLCVSKSSGDEAQKLRWAMLLQYKRIIVSNEIETSVKLDGNMINKLASEGDPLTGRGHGGNETLFNTHFLPIILANDLPKITKFDTAVEGRVKVVSYVKNFVDEPSNEFELKKDPKLKAEIKTLRFQKVFVGLLLREYYQFLQYGEVEPAEVIKAKKDWVSQDNNCIDTFKLDFEISNVETDWVTSKTIEAWLIKNEIGITMKKFGMEMDKYLKINKIEKVHSKPKKINGKVSQVWIGIKEIREVYDDDESCVDGDETKTEKL